MAYAKGKLLLFTRHALDRITQRNVTEEQIITTIEKPQSETKARTKGARKARRRFGQRVVFVVYLEQRHEIRVLTVG